MSKTLDSKEAVSRPASPAVPGSSRTPAVQAGVVPNSLTIEAFDPEKTSWCRWLQRLQGAFLIFNIREDGRVPYLLHYVGSSAFDILCDRLDPEDPFQQRFERLTSLLENFYEPPPLEIAENFRFHQRRQENGENVQQFASALHKLSIHCKFGDYLKTALRNQLVFGLASKKIQTRLLVKKDLTYEEALKVATTMELSEKGSSSLQVAHTGAPVQVDTVLTGKRNPRRQQTSFTKATLKGKPTQGRTNNFNSSPTPRYQTFNSRAQTGNFKFKREPLSKTVTCYRCGKGHLASQCDLDRNLKCLGCGEKGHLRKVCFKSREQANQLEDILHLEHPQFRDKFFCALEINNKPVSFEVDSGSAVTIMNKNDASRLFPGSIINHTDLNLLAFCKTIIKVVGYITVKVKHTNMLRVLNIYLTIIKRKPLLGREWIRQLFSCVDFPKILSCDAMDNITTGSSKNLSLQNILHKYQEVRSNDWSKIAGVQAKLHLIPNPKPVFLKARSVPFKIKELLEKELDELLQAGVLEKTETSEWATPIVPILKPNGCLRICGDYKATLNTQLKVDEHPLSNINEIFTRLAGGSKFSKIDLRQAYLQLEVDAESSKLLTLNTHKCLYKVNRLMYGIASAPAIWQRTIENILQDIPGTAVFLDDIVITGENEQVHLQRLQSVMQKLHSHNIRINMDKSKFLMNEIQYCGFTLRKEGIIKQKSKMEAIKDMPHPRNPQELRAFLGMINYYGRFIPNLSTILYPLNTLLHLNSKFVWTNKQEQAFLQAKKAFLSNKILAHYNPKLPLILATDASPYGVGAVLSQLHPDGTEKVIQYASQTLTKTQQNYSQIDKEAYSIIFGIKKFHQYLFGNHFTLLTDHKPLIQIFAPNKSLPVYSAMRMQHYAIFLQGFQYKIKYRKSTEHSNADCLSRLPVSNNNTIMDVVEAYQLEELQDFPINASIIEKETKRDPELIHLVHALQSGKQVQNKERFNLNQEEFTIQNNILFRGFRVVIPKSLQSKILNQLHTGHFGINKMKAIARSFCWWSGIDTDIQKLVYNCAACNATRNNPPKIEKHIWEPASAPMHRIHADFAGPFLGKWFLVIIDAYSKWPEVKIMKNITAKSTITEFKNFFASFGFPKIIVTDNGTNFVSEEFQRFLKLHGITHKRTSPYNPATNGQAERFIQTLKNALKRANATETNVNSNLKKFLLHYRAAPHASTNVSPAELFLGHKIRTKLDLIFPSQKEEATANFAIKVKQLRLGQRVACRNYIGNVKWKYGYVKKVIGKLHYEITLDDDRIWKRHINQLRAIGAYTPASDGHESYGPVEDILQDQNPPILYNSPKSFSRSPTKPPSPHRPEQIVKSPQITPDIRRSSRKRQPPSRFGETLQY
ncbi:hypothetical protein PUN28_020833 [Cardiocondyla obscurior]